MKLTMPSTRTRGYLYRVTAAAGAVALFYGVVTAEELVVWLALAWTVLANAVAAVNTPTTPSS